MRRLVTVLLVLAVAPPAWAAPADKPRRKPIPPPPRATAQPPTPTRRAAVAPPPLAATAFGAEPATRLPRLVGQGLGGQGLARLDSGVDGAPVCRSACADRRYTCQEQYEDAACAPAWTQCVLACRGGR